MSASQKGTLTFKTRYGIVEGLTPQDVAELTRLLESGQAGTLNANGRVFTLRNFNRTIEGSMDEIAFFLWITIRGPENTGQTRWKFDPAKHMIFAYNSEGREFWKRSTLQALPEALRPIIGTEIKAGRLKVPQAEQDVMFAKTEVNGAKPAEPPVAVEAVTEMPAETIPEPAEA